MTVSDVAQRLKSILQLIAPRMLSILLTMMLVAFLWNVVQVGFLVAPEVLCRISAGSIP